MEIDRIKEFINKYLFRVFDIFKLDELYAKDILCIGACCFCHLRSDYNICFVSESLNKHNHACTWTKKFSHKYPGMTFGSIRPVQLDVYGFRFVRKSKRSVGAISIINKVFKDISLSEEKKRILNLDYYSGECCCLGGKSPLWSLE